MSGIYLRKDSAAARWCQRTALVCIPYFGLAILLHRFGRITSPQAFWLLAFGLIMLFVSLALGIRAIMEHWYEGKSGGRSTIRGILLALAMAAPYAWFGYLAVKYPLLSDITTNPVSPPEFFRVAQIRSQGISSGMNQLGAFDDDYSGIAAGAYPKLASRRYNAGAERVYKSVAALIRDRGWIFLETRGIAEAEIPAIAEEEGEDRPAEAGKTSKKDKAKTPQSAAGKKGGAAGKKPAARVAVLPEKARDIEIEAVAASILFGFNNDIAIAIITEEESTLVDMRSSSRYGPHDFGSNERLIRKFLADLDKSLVGTAGEG